MKIITLKELSDILNISTDSIRTWLNGYRFSKYRTLHGCIYSRSFVYNLIEFLEIKRRDDSIKLLKNYIKKYRPINYTEQEVEDFKENDNRKNYSHINRIFWTKSAIECYKIKCDCTKCELKKVLNIDCRMKEFVLELIKKYGLPKMEDENE